MELKFTAFAHVARPVEQVFEAVADPEQLSRYFTTGGAEGRLETGTVVSWEFHDFPGAFPVEVVEAEANERIVLRWAANEDGPAGYSTKVTFTFEPTADGRTRVSVAEEGWRDTAAGLAASYGNCMGWSQMLCALKIWVEHGINLREGMYR
ncbi:MAG: hypothetical protein QOI38_2875 [Sphingomonadales bacterium]|jgi:uncharacterized protein YndB with AHSA1/START domain|nr:hypothetical protein [Sphingomonadales bacterium]